MASHQSRVALLSAEFEQLVVEYNKLLGEGGSVGAVAGRETAKEAPFRKLLEKFPAPVYTTDAAGRITFYNEAAVKFAGRRAQLGIDEWCVTWRLYWPDGTPLPHDQCPMALALKQNRAVRGAQAIAERPDGTRVPYVPYPTPLRDASGALVGAVNMMLDASEPEQVLLYGARVLVVAADNFVAAELDFLIDDAGGEAVALTPNIGDALNLLSERNIDAVVISLPFQDEHLRPLINALVRQQIPFVFHEGNEQHVVQMLGSALSVRPIVLASHQGDGTPRHPAHNPA